MKGALVGIVSLLASFMHQGRRKHLKLVAARHFEGTFSLRKRGHFLKTKKGTSLFLAKSWGHVPIVPPGSYVYVMHPQWKYAHYFPRQNKSVPEMLSKCSAKALGTPLVMLEFSFLMM